jgi:hypothetical protein
VRLTTVNGSVSVGLPARINATIDASTVNGRVETDFPVKITGKISKTHLRGVIGSGGPTVTLGTVNGSVMLHEAGPSDHPAMDRAPRAHRVRGMPPTPQTPAPDKP